MLTRFVITEFFRKPDEDYGHLKIWRHKRTGKEKRKIYYGHSDNTEMFFDEDGKLHKDNDQPAVITTNSGKEYYCHGQRHRGHFEPAISYPDGRKEYWVFGEKRFETGTLTKNE